MNKQQRRRLKRARKAERKKQEMIKAVESVLYVPTAKLTPKQRFERALCLEEKRKQRTTEAESALSSILVNIGVPYIKEKSFVKRDKIYVVDFFIPKPYLIAIEVDGGYHKLPKQVELDKERSEFLRIHYKVHTIRIRNEEILQKPEIVKSQLRTKLRNPSSSISSITSNRVNVRMKNNV